jgi:hypothetical protein
MKADGGVEVPPLNPEGGWAVKDCDRFPNVTLTLDEWRSC